MRALLAFLFVLAFAGQAIANAPSSSLRPKPREAKQPEVRRVLVPVGYRPSIRPRPRPVVTGSGSRQGVGQNRPDAVVIVTSVAGVTRSLRPKLRPRNLERRFARRVAAAARRAQKAGRPAQAVATIGKSGKICGDRGIQGQRVAAISGRLKGCGVANPVKITSIDGVGLTQASIMDCDTARALQTWIAKGAKPAVGRKNGGLKSLKVVAHYSCRTRNSQKGERISEHGKGKAIDIAAINFKNGESINLLQGWRHRTYGPMLKQMHRSACGPFGTVLGPNSNRFHQDHFHFDTARYRGGPYCK